MSFGIDPKGIPSADKALPGRAESMQVKPWHFVNGNSIVAPFPDETDTIVFGLGCFWGAERRFWQTPGVYSTAVGYAGGYTPNPSYHEVCSGQTGHAEVVLVVYDKRVTNLDQMLKVFWEAHNPTQGMRQGNDIGTQYRSTIYFHSDWQHSVILNSLGRYQDALRRSGRGGITTEVAKLGSFYYAEDYHQQYLAKNPSGYCGLGGCGVSYPGE